MLTDDGARAAAGTADEEYQGDYYTYTGGAGANAAGANTTGANAAGAIRPAPGRPLPPVPGDATGAPGQSGHAEAEMDRMVNGVRTLQLGESQGTQVESFLVQTRARRTGPRRLASAPARRGPSGAPRHASWRGFTSLRHWARRPPRARVKTGRQPPFAALSVVLARRVK